MTINLLALSTSPELSFILVILVEASHDTITLLAFAVAIVLASHISYCRNNITICIKGIRNIVPYTNYIHDGDSKINSKSLWW